MSGRGGEVVHGTLQTEALPYVHAPSGLNFTITDCDLDTGVHVEVQEGRRYVPLTEETQWDTARLFCELEVPQETLDMVFPEDEQDTTPGRLVVAIWCRAAIGRAGRHVASPPLKAGTHKFELPLQRDELRGDVTVQPFVVRDSTRSGEGQYADRRGMWVATSNPWTVGIDEPYEGGGLLQPIVEPFSAHDHFPDDQLHFLSLDDPESPQLFLNGDHQLVVSVLNSEGTTGSEARLRDVLFDQIEVSVWTTLLMRTIDDFSVDTGEFEYGWEETAFDLFYNHLFVEADDFDDALEDLADLLEERSNRADLHQRVERAIYERMEMPDDTVKLIEEAIQRD